MSQPLRQAQINIPTQPLQPLQSSQNVMTSQPTLPGIPVGQPTSSGQLPQGPTYVGQPIYQQSQQPSFPVQPGYQPTSPGQQPQQPSFPVQPGYQPTSPGQQPQQSSFPVQPGYQPTSPGQQPQQSSFPVQPGYQPTSPGQQPQQPSFPFQPGYQTTSPGQMPVQSGYQPTSSGFPAMSTTSPGIQFGLQATQQMYQPMAQQDAPVYQAIQPGMQMGGQQMVGMPPLQLGSQPMMGGQGMMWASQPTWGNVGGSVMGASAMGFGVSTMQVVNPIYANIDPGAVMRASPNILQVSTMEPLQSTEVQTEISPGIFKSAYIPVSNVRYPGDWDSTVMIVKLKGSQLIPADQTMGGISGQAQKDIDFEKLLPELDKKRVGNTFIVLSDMYNLAKERGWNKSTPTSSITPYELFAFIMDEEERMGRITKQKLAEIIVRKGIKSYSAKELKAYAKYFKIDVIRKDDILLRLSDIAGGNVY